MILASCKGNRVVCTHTKGLMITVSFSFLFYAAAPANKRHQEPFPIPTLDKFLEICEIFVVYVMIKKILLGKHMTLKIAAIVVHGFQKQDDEQEYKMSLKNGI